MKALFFPGLRGREPVPPSGAQQLQHACATLTRLCGGTPFTVPTAMVSTAVGRSAIGRQLFRAFSTHSKLTPAQAVSHVFLPLQDRSIIAVRCGGPLGAAPDNCRAPCAAVTPRT